jgi:hypothetical protein
MILEHVYVMSRCLGFFALVVPSLYFLPREVPEPVPLAHLGANAEGLAILN